jgi:hypothetical protein
MINSSRNNCEIERDKNLLLVACGNVFMKY